MSNSFSKDEFYTLKELYKGITQGTEDNPSDELNYLLNKPFEFSMVYEGRTLGDSKDCFSIVDTVEEILIKNGITLPDCGKLSFSSINELNGWGNDFDGKFLLII